MKYPIESLELNFDVAIKYNTTGLYIWKTEDGYLQRKQMFCYTFDLDYDTELNTTDIEKVQECYGAYMTEDDVERLSKDKVLRADLFFAMTNSPRCPYKIIGTSAYKDSAEVITVYHFMIKHDILTKSKTVVI
jgi:hypothetical protein